MSLGSKYKRVHDAIYAEQVGSFRFERKIATSRGTNNSPEFHASATFDPRGLRCAVGGVCPIFVDDVKLDWRQVNSECLMGLIRTEFENNNYLRRETKKKMTCWASKSSFTHDT
jgi:hypothetical protein